MPRPPPFGTVAPPRHLLRGAVENPFRGIRSPAAGPRRHVSCSSETVPSGRFFLLSGLSETKPEKVSLTAAFRPSSLMIP
jgi:hypothetical protein